MHGIPVAEGEFIYTDCWFYMIFFKIEKYLFFLFLTHPDQSSMCIQVDKSKFALS